MNAENIAKALKCCYPPEGANTCEGCPYDGMEDPSCIERNFEYKAGEIIESLLSQLDSVMASNDRFDTDNSILLKERDAVIKEKERLRVELAYADAQINWDNDKRAELEDLLDAAIAGQETLQKAFAESQRREREARLEVCRRCPDGEIIDGVKHYPCDGCEWRGTQEGELNAETDNPD